MNPEYVYNPNTQTVHDFPGCRHADKIKQKQIWTVSEYEAASRERGVIHRCRECFR